MAFECEYPFDDSQGKVQIQIGAQDVATLDDKCWLNCNVVSKNMFNSKHNIISKFVAAFFLKYFHLQMKKELQAEVHVFSNNFYTKLLDSKESKRPMTDELSKVHHQRVA